MAQARHGRRGDVFSIRVTEEDRTALEALQLKTAGPRGLGPFLLWCALRRDRAGTTAAPRVDEVLPPVPRARAARGPGSTATSIADRSWRLAAAGVPVAKRVILDLCAGSGSWSEPYRKAGYKVVRITLPRHDVRTFVARGRVWGILAAPPCTEFSLAKRGDRDFVEGMACVNACLRIVQQAMPVWWALENPVGKLRLWMGEPRDVFEPCDFGDPWTKRTALWGTFTRPERGPFVKPAAGKLTLERTAAERARTPEGFARAFFEANP